jgi:membrane associated rhomboid family serine protease
MEQAEQSRIPTRTRKQAMDWGLVLMSQGIVATIDDGAEGAGWGLVVQTSDYPAAMRAIRLYRLENRHWPWRQPLSWRSLLFDWKILFWALLLVAVYSLSQTSRLDFPVKGRMDNAAVCAGEWWRVFTAMLLHADAAHLAANISLGVVLLGLAMGRYGGGLGILASYLAGAAGNVAGLLLYPGSHLGVGASGMVMGGLGMLAAQSVTLLRNNLIGRKQMFRGLMGGVMLFVFFGLSPNTDVIAHLGGFVAGLAFGGMLVCLPARWKNPKTDLVAGIFFVGLLVTTSWLAFRSPPS